MILGLSFILSASQHLYLCFQINLSLSLILRCVCPDWVLDVEFGEDDSRVRFDNAPENLAVIRHIALNLLKQNKNFKGSIKSKRNRAGWDDNYLREILLN